jgi:hypothetical protein
MPPVFSTKERKVPITHRQIVRIRRRSIAIEAGLHALGDLADLSLGRGAMERAGGSAAGLATMRGNEISSGQSWSTIFKKGPLTAASVKGAVAQSASQSGPPKLLLAP